MRQLETRAAAALLGVACAAAPLGSAASEPAAQDPPAPRAAVAERMYRGPGLQAFRVGHRAWELKDWNKVLSDMAQAMAQDADQPEAQVRLSGVFWTPYIPKYYQSHAQCQLRHCTEARRDMDDVLRLIKDAPSYLRNKYQKDCQNKCPAAPGAQTFMDSPEPDPRDTSDRPAAPARGSSGPAAEPGRAPERRPSTP
jgi:hypothetical protein